MPKADFSKWDRNVLEQFARQAADENKALREAVEQLRDDLKEAMRMLREKNK